MILMGGLMAMTVNADSSDVRVTRLENGLTWIHRPVRHNQIVAFQLFIPGGILQEDPARAGLSHLMVSVMFKGTTSRTFRQIAEETESLGFMFGGDAEEDYISFSGQVVADRFPRAFTIFSDILLNPSFPAEEFEKEKEAQLNDIKAKKEHIFTVAFERLQGELFGSHPYGQPAGGTEETVGRMERDDLSRWHSKVIRPRGAVLVTVGSLPEKDVTDLLATCLGRWTGDGWDPSAQKELVPQRQEQPVDETRSFEQAYLMMAYPADAVSGRDYAAIKTLNTLLGGGMSSPLFQSIRETSGLAYEVSSFYPSRKYGSAFVLYAGTDESKMPEVESKMRALLRDFSQTPVSDQKLRESKRYVRGHYMMDHQTNERVGWYTAWWETLGRGHSYDKTYLQDVDAVTSEDVRRTAQRLFSQPPVVVRIHPPSKNNPRSP